MNGLGETPEQVLYPERVFDGQAFRRIRRRVLAATAVEPVVVDLRNVRSCDLSALADLFGLLARLHGMARVRMLRGQQSALFELLGVNRSERRLRWRWQRDGAAEASPERR